MCQTIEYDPLRISEDAAENMELMGAWEWDDHHQHCVRCGTWIYWSDQGDDGCPVCRGKEVIDND